MCEWHQETIKEPAWGNVRPRLWGIKTGVLGVFGATRDMAVFNSSCLRYGRVQDSLGLEIDFDELNIPFVAQLQLKSLKTQLREQVCLGRACVWPLVLQQNLIGATATFI